MQKHQAGVAQRLAIWKDITALDCGTRISRRRQSWLDLLEYVVIVADDGPQSHGHETVTLPVVFLVKLFCTDVFLTNCAGENAVGGTEAKGDNK